MDAPRFALLVISEADQAEARADRERALAAGTSIVDYFAGCMTHLYPDPEDTRRFLDEVRGYTDDDTNSGS